MVLPDSVFILDKVENNRARLDNSDRPVSGSILTLSDNTVRAVDVRTNAFCAGGALLSNGTWAVFGGNQAIGFGGTAVPDGTGPYTAIDGRKAVRLLDPQDDNADLFWLDDGSIQMTNVRWYPGAETLPTGEVLLLGGATGGGLVSRASVLRAVVSVDFDLWFRTFISLMIATSIATLSTPILRIKVRKRSLTLSFLSKH